MEAHKAYKTFINRSLQDKVIKEELEKLMHFKIDIINFRDSFKQYILILRVYSASQLFK